MVNLSLISKANVPIFRLKDQPEGTTGPSEKSNQGKTELSLYDIFSQPYILKDPKNTLVTLINKQTTLDLEGT
jgi:hypothetical protein